MGKTPITSTVPVLAQNCWLTAPAKEIGLKVGIGIGTGSGADNFAYAEVGDISITNPNNYAGGPPATTPTTPDTTGTWDTGLIDRIRSTDNPPFVMVAPGLPYHKWNWELHSIPLSGFAQSPGTGYYNQGDPVFAGPGWSTTHLRSDLAGAGAPTGGMEQWIEVRSVLYPTDVTKDLSNLPVATAASGDLSTLASILVGYGGCYVYLICKKHLTE